MLFILFPVLSANSRVIGLRNDFNGSLDDYRSKLRLGINALLLITLVPMPIL